MRVPISAFVHAVAGFDSGVNRFQSFPSTKALRSRKPPTGMRDHDGESDR